MLSARILTQPGIAQVWPGLKPPVPYFVYNICTCTFLSGPDGMAYLPFVPQLVDADLITFGDDISQLVNIAINFPFGGTLFSNLYVCT